MLYLYVFLLGSDNNHVIVCIIQLIPEHCPSVSVGPAMGPSSHF